MCREPGQLGGARGTPLARPRTADAAGHAEAAAFYVFSNFSMYCMLKCPNIAKSMLQTPGYFDTSTNNFTCLGSEPYSGVCFEKLALDVSNLWKFSGLVKCNIIYCTNQCRREEIFEV